MSYVNAFIKASAWSNGIYRARPGTTQHIGHTIHAHALCGKNTTTMQAVYLERIKTQFAGTAKLIELNALRDADVIMEFVTCKNCRAALAAKGLMEGADALDV